MSDTLRSSVCAVPSDDLEPNLNEIDEALLNAVMTRANTRDSKKHIIDHFIDDLLDQRLDKTK